jgi:hypothetical protein
MTSVVLYSHHIRVYMSVLGNALLISAAVGSLVVHTIITQVCYRIRDRLIQ